MDDPVLARRGLLCAGLGCGVVALVGATGACSPSSTGATATPPPFPTQPSVGLSSHQRRVLAILRTEYSVQPPGTKYSQGVEENWCADFVSWVLREAGRPLRNPNSGGWRIPGTMTLLDTFRTMGVWRPSAGSARPVPGDVVIYDGGGPFGQHTNFALSQEGTKLTTVGGNEPQRNISVSTHTRDASLGMLGFAHLV